MSCTGTNLSIWDLHAQTKCHYTLTIDHCLEKVKKTLTLLN
jgi:hypothetical protein